MKFKIPKTSKKERTAWIKACQKLLAWYKDGIKLRKGCPFCDIADKHEDDDGDLNCRCPWFWFTGGLCRDSYSNPSPVWKKRRIRELRQWIKALRGRK